MRTPILLTAVVLLVVGVATAQQQTKSVSDLPLLGQYAVSAALSKDQAIYRLRPEGTAHRVTNSRHGRVADLGPGGIEIQAGKTQFGLSLKALGFEGAGTPVAAAGKPVVSDNRIEFERSTLTEWYVNGPLGLQQGFTVARAPTGGDAEPLTLVLAVSGGLCAVVNSDGAGLTLRGTEGADRFRYSGLTAYDANGRTFPAWLELAAGEIQIRVDADGVCDPLVNDPEDSDKRQHRPSLREVKKHVSRNPHIQN